MEIDSDAGSVGRGYGYVACGEGILLGSPGLKLAIASRVSKRARPSWLCRLAEQTTLLHPKNIYDLMDHAKYNPDSGAAQFHLLAPVQLRGLAVGQHLSDFIRPQRRVSQVLRFTSS